MSKMHQYPVAILLAHCLEEQWWSYFYQWSQLANANVKVQSAAKKPNLFAFGEYSLDDKQNWIVGVVARYNLFSGVDKNKNIQAAELQRYASELLTERTKQEREGKKERKGKRRRRRRRRRTERKRERGRYRRYRV